MSQPQLMEAFKTIKACADTPSSKDKIKILKAGDTPYLRKLLFYTYNKFITYRLKQIEQPETFAAVQPDMMEEFETLCTMLSAHEIGSKEAKNRVKYFLAKCTPEGAEIFTNVLLRDLRAGIDVKTVNKAMPGLVPTFNVMLADKLEDMDSLPYPVVTECKLDGCRVVAIYDGNTVKFFSREGMQFNEKGVIAKEIEMLAPGCPAVYDGEIIAVKPNMQNKTCAKNINGNWKFNYALSALKSEDTTADEVREHLKFFIWDVIDYEHFVSSGLRGQAETLSARKIRLTGLFARHPESTFKNIELLENLVCNNRDELVARFKDLRAQGEEGMMVKFPASPYEYKRSKYLLKMKEFFSFDLRIVNIEEGKGKYEGLLGALVCEDDTGTIKTKVGSGFTDEDRAELLVEWMGGRLEGQIVEVSAQEVTEDGSLRFPTFICLRSDKSTANIEGTVI